MTIRTWTLAGVQGTGFQETGRSRKFNGRSRLFNGRSHLMGVPDCLLGVPDCLLGVLGNLMGVLGYLLGVLDCLLGVLGYLLGVPEKSGIDDWKSRCNLPPAGGKLHLLHFTMNGRSRWLNLLKKVWLHSA